MMKKSLFAVILFGVTMLFAAPLAHATTVTEVQAMIASLKAKVEIVGISGKNAELKDRPGLKGKLTNASLALDQAKFCESIQKINEFKSKINYLIGVGKINQDPETGPTGQELLTDADAIIARTNDLAVQSSGAACVF